MHRNQKSYELGSSYDPNSCFCWDLIKEISLLVNKQITVSEERLSYLNSYFLGLRQSKNHLFTQEYIKNNQALIKRGIILSSRDKVNSFKGDDNLISTDFKRLWYFFYSDIRECARGDNKLYYLELIKYCVDTE